MPVSTVTSAFLVLLPVLFVMALGFAAGRFRRFDSDQVQGLNELVLAFALPALLFVGIVTTPRSSLMSAGPFVLALFFAFVGLFVVMSLISVLVWRRRVETAALQASCMVFANVAFIGLPILTPLFGPSTTFSVGIAALVSQVMLVPLTVTLLEYGQHSAGARSSRLPALVGRSLFSSFEQPVVLAPLLATLLVLMAVPVPTEIESMLSLIGSATAGVAVFVAGLIVAAYHVKVTMEVAANTLVKMIVQPALMAFLVAVFGLRSHLAAKPFFCARCRPPSFLSCSRCATKRTRQRPLRHCS